MIKSLCRRVEVDDTKRIVSNSALTNSIWLFHGSIIPSSCSNADRFFSSFNQTHKYMQTLEKLVAMLFSLLWLTCVAMDVCVYSPLIPINPSVCYQPQQDYQPSPAEEVTQDNGPKSLIWHVCICKCVEKCVRVCVFYSPAHSWWSWACIQNI